MSEQPQRLYLRHGHLKFNAPTVGEQTRIVADLQYIHDPSTLKLGRAFRSYFWHNFDLRARPHDNAAALFGATIYRNDMDGEVTAMVDRTDLASQAAGWSALQLYHETSKNVRLPYLNVVDPLEDTFGRSTHRRFRVMLEQEVTGEASMSVFRPFDGELLIACAGGGAPSEVLVRNKGSQSLPGLLHTIKTGYDELYPGSHTSEAVAGIVGATNLEEFTEAWAAAAEHEPVVTARMLLESNVFIADP